MTKYRFRSTKLYVGLLVFFVILYLIKLQGVLLPDVISQHISNFSITGALFLISSFGLLRREHFTKRRLMLEMLPFVFLNIVIELLVRVDTIEFGGMSIVNFNTPDTMDMISGIASLVLIYFAVIKVSTIVTTKVHEEVAK